MIGGGDGAVLPADWQDRIVEMARGAEPLDGRWFSGGPALSPLRQIDVYREQYRHRLYGALKDEVPGLMFLLGEEAAEPLLRAYLFDCPSRSWTLNRVAERLAEWLAARDAPVEQVEMAKLDRAVQRGFEAGEGRPLRAEDMARGIPNLRLQPHVALLRHRTNVHAVRSAGLAGRAPPPLQRGDVPLVVFRRGIQMRHWKVPLGAWGILEAIADGFDVAAAVERTFVRGWIDPEHVAGRVEEWFQDFVERGLVEVTSEARPRNV